jgi:hypothetical protein
MLAFFAFASLIVQQLPPYNAWSSTSIPPGSYAVDSGGSLIAGTGRLSIRATSATPQSNGSVTFSLPADTLRLRRVVLTGEVRGHGNASLVVRGANYAARAFSTAGGALTAADTQWTKRDLQLVVSRTSVRIDVMAAVRGIGDIEARGLKLSVQDLPAANTALSSEAQREVDEAINIARRQSFWRDTVTWSEVESDVRRFAAGAQTAAETYPAIRELLMRLGDHHSFLMPAQQATQWQSGTLVKNPLPTVKALENHIGYISVPAYSGGDAAGMREYATGTHDLLTSTAPSSTCGWVLDLRQNGGGNMWPMLAGLKPFVGDAHLGSFSGPSGSGASWIAGQAVGVDPPKSLGWLDSSAVAVLIGPRTASSGEAVAVAFHGRPRTRFFGQPTAGLANANGTMKLPDGAMMMVMTSVDVDRNGQRFGEKVVPDETISQPDAQSPTSASDATLTAATRWLTSQASCRGR